MNKAMTALEKMAAAMAEAAVVSSDGISTGVWGHMDDATRYAMTVMAVAALNEIRDPGDAAFKAAFNAMNLMPRKQWKAMKAYGATPRELFDAKLAPLWAAMIDAILTGKA